MKRLPKGCRGRLLARLQFTWFCTQRYVEATLLQGCKATLPFGCLANQIAMILLSKISKYRKNIEKISTLKLPKACHATKMQGRLASLYKGSQNDVLGAKVGVFQHCQTAAVATFWQPSGMRPSIPEFWLLGRHMATLPGNLLAAYWQGCISLDFAPKALLWQHLCELDMRPKYKVALQACIKVAKLTFWVQK